MTCEDGRDGWAGLVDDENGVIEGRAVLAVLSARDRDDGAHGIAGLDLPPPASERGAIVAHPLANDGDKTASIREPFQGLLQVPGAVARLALTLNSASRGTEWRVHHTYRRNDAARQDVMDLLGVLSVEGCVWKQSG